MATLPSIAQILLPKKKTNPKGQSYTSTFNPSSTETVLSAPQYRDHLTDIFTTRQSDDSRALIKSMAKFDTDMSATIHAYLTICNTEPRFYVYDMEGNLDREGTKQFEMIKRNLTQKNDYTVGFSFTHSIRQIADNLRYMTMIRGGCASELIFNKFLLPAEVRSIDLADIEWFEKAPGVYKPQQRPPGANDVISLDIANFFVKFYRQNPTEIYSESMFVSSINTIAARQQVINDLYRIMQKTGYPRIEATIVEEVLRKNAPENIKQDENAMRTWLNTRLEEVSAGMTNMRPDAVFVHFDSVEVDTINSGGPGKAFDVSAIIEVLNSQNQAALKTMATIIGRGESGVNTASVEARVFCMSADSLNNHVSDIFSEMFSLALQLTGYLGYVECHFDKVELRPDLELEAQRTMKHARLVEDLSLGLITDDEYHIEMYNRPRPDSSPELSGTNFSAAGSAVDAGSISPNSDPLGRSVSSADNKSAKSNTVKKAT